MTDTAREFDVVVYGASGFVGRLLAEYLAEAAPPGTRIALAGRSEQRLREVRDGLPEAARDWPLRTADATDRAALDTLARSSRVVATTVGPYVRYGAELVGACARAGTHYADLTGEVLFVRQSIDRWHDTARETGARLVHACGYDSIPSDLTALALHRAADAAGAGGLGAVRLVATFRGGLSGGTVDSIRAQVAAMGADPAARRLAADPYALSPDRDAEPDARQPPDAGPPFRTADGTWVAPFVMASFNTRVVRRSNALQGWAYGRGLRYGEVMGCGRGPLGVLAAGGLTAGLGAALGAFAVPPTRALLDRVLPAPGSGPSEETRRRGWFRMDAQARTEDGRHLRATTTGTGDPGYAATAVMLGQSALALALDGDRLPDAAGSLTPATAMGEVLTDRLRAAGHRYDVHEPVG